MKKLFVPYELALLAKEKKFADRCLAGYCNGEIQIRNVSFQSDIIGCCLAPLHQQLIDWFLNKHNLLISINYNGSESLYWQIKELKPFGKEYDGILTDELEYLTTQYYDVLNKAFKEAFKLIQPMTTKEEAKAELIELEERKKNLLEFINEPELTAKEQQLVVDEFLNCKKNKIGLTVKELFEILDKLIENGKGDYKMKIDVNEYYVNLKEIQIIDESKSDCENSTVSVL